MAIENGTQIKIVFPEHMQRRLEADAAAVAVPVASIVRMIIASHYELLANQQPTEESPTQQMKSNGASPLLAEAV